MFASLDRVARFLLVRTRAVDFQAHRVPDRCPVCGGPGKGSPDHTCADPECGTRWGVRTCACGAVIPKVLPGLPNQTLLEDALLDTSKPAARSQLLETLGGRDLLADLCLSDEVMADGAWWVICPGCGTCGKEKSCGRDCVRCRG